MSLFSNCGAGDVGYRQAGFRFVVMAEIDDRRLTVAGLNHPGAALVPGDLRKTWPQVVAAYRKAKVGRLDLLAACPPCQGMSSVQESRGKADDPDAGSKDARNLLVMPIAEVAAALRPRTIVVENVPVFLRRLIRHPDSDAPVSAAQLLIDLLSVDYVVFPIVADLADYGVPQTRRRAFLTFVRRDEPALRRLNTNELAPYPIPSHGDGTERQRITLRKALRRLALPALDAGSAEDAADPKRRFHVVPTWPAPRYNMIKAIPRYSGASAWDNDRCPSCRRKATSRLRARCEWCGSPLARPLVRARNGRDRLIRGFTSTSYRRMPPDAPAPTITTASGHVGSDLTVHPWEHRVLSPLECAALQTFPRTFRWGDAFDKWGHTLMRTMIGEAVPPKFTAAHGRVLARLLAGKRATRMLRREDRRVRAGSEALHNGVSGRGPGCIARSSSRPQAIPTVIGVGKRVHLRASSRGRSINRGGSRQTA